MAGRTYREESHFGDRIVRCAAGRPNDIGAMLAAARAANPAGDALVDGAVRLSHDALHARAGAVAAQLRGLGVAPGDRVAVLVGNRAGFVLGLLGAIRAGAIAVPIPVRSSAPETAFIIDDSGAKLTVCDEGTAALLPAGAPRLMAADLAESGDIEPPAPAEEDPAVILYTSGTTGRPKGAMLTHLNIVHSSLAYIDVFGLGPEDRTVVAVPASHVTGLIGGVFALLASGGGVAMQEKFEVEGFLTLAATERMSFTIMAPAMYNLILLRADPAAHDLSRWRVGAFGGAPMPVATIERLGEILPDLTLAQAYGSTETCSPATIMPLGRQIERPTSVGAPVAHADIRIMDPEGRALPPGAHGEIWIGGPMVAPGYWRAPEKTRESFHAGYWRSGDIGRLDEAGFLFVHDRLKDMVNRGGYKVYSAEVENALSHHPGVAEAAVVPRPDPVLGEKTCAFVHLSDASVDAETLRDFCRARLSDYKTPDIVVFTPGPLPRNANGKVMKQVLKEQAAREA